jgi:FAD/FMN-containing dehydrogenase
MIDLLRGILGDKAVLTSATDLEPYLSDNACRTEGSLICVARPSTTAEVSRVIVACAQNEVAVVPRGGGTGLAGGSVPGRNEKAVVVALDRMNAIRSVDLLDEAMIVEAGVTLEQARDEAHRHNRTIGLDHGGKGSSQIGGNLATNAGGNNVIRYGMARDQVLGIEAVLADGSIIGPPYVLRKSNAGYDLRHLLIGSEGTLGIITAAALKLRPNVVSRTTALLALGSAKDALSLLLLARDLLGEQIVACELMSQSAVDFHFSHVGQQNTLLKTSAWTVLLEAESSLRMIDLDSAFYELLRSALEKGIVQDGIVAASEAQRLAMWKVREGIAVAMHASRLPIVRTDTAVPIRAIADFVALTVSRTQTELPGSVAVHFGHLGDGNIHFNVLPPPAMDHGAFIARKPEIHGLIEQIALSLGGSVSAEHGIGQSKREALLRMKSPTEINLMRAIKMAFDPQQILNSSKIIYRQ